MPRLAALAIATILLSGCATVGSNPPIGIVCPPVVQYSRDAQARAAEELNSLPDGSVIAEMLADYAVIRDQTRACTHAARLRQKLEIDVERADDAMIYAIG